MERTTRFSHRNHHARRKQKRRSRGKRESATRALPSQPSRSVSRARARARARLRKSKKTTKADLDVARQKRHFKPHFSKAHLFHILVAVVTLHVRLFFALRVRVVIVVRERDVVVRTGLVSSFFSSSSSFRTHSSYFFLCPEECGRRRVSAKSVLFPPPFVLFFLANFQGLRNQIRLCGALFETALAQKKAEKKRVFEYIISFIGKNTVVAKWGATKKNTRTRRRVCFLSRHHRRGAHSSCRAKQREAKKKRRC